MKYPFYILAALIGAGLIIYGTFFYTNPASKEASILPQIINPKLEEPFLGNAEAPVTIIEYGSYLCGHCADFQRDTLPQIEEKYIQTNKVKFIYRSFPPIELAIADWCAQEQNKFWEYHNYVFQRDIGSVDDLKQYAKDVGLDETKFSECLDSEKYKNEADNWYNMGKAAGVDGTPTFFINDQKVVGNLPYEEFEKIIEEKLK